MASKRVQITILLAAIFFIGSSSSEEPPTPVYGVPSYEEVPAARIQYIYTYDIRDPQSGVFTSKKESRDGDLVFGNYVIEDPDGTRRTVYYSSDAVRGFTADIHSEEVSAKQEGEPAKEVEEPAKEEEEPAKEDAEPAKEDEEPAKEEDPKPPMLFQIPIHLPLAFPFHHTYLAPPQEEAPPLLPPPTPQIHHFQFGQPLAFALAPAILTKTDAASTKSETESPKYSVSLTSPTHGYTY